MTIVGIDPGYDRLGWGVIKKDKNTFALIDCGCIKTAKTLSQEERLLTIFNELSQLITTFSIDTMVIETLFFSKNVTSALSVAQARGVILLVGAQHQLKIQEISPNQVKLAVTGSGNADKKTVEKMVRLQIKGIPDKMLDDTLDAIAIGMSYTTNRY